MKKSILKNLDMSDGMVVTLAMLREYPMQYIGVIGLDGKPKVKAFEFTRPLSLNSRRMGSSGLIRSGGKRHGRRFLSILM